MEHMGRKPGFTFLTLSVFSFCQRRPGELVLLDFRDPRRDAKGVTAFFFENSFFIFRLLTFRVSTSPFRFSIDVLQASRSFEPNAHYLGWFASPGSHRGGVVFDHLRRNSIKVSSKKLQDSRKNCDQHLPLCSCSQSPRNSFHIVACRPPS